MGDGREGSEGDPEDDDPEPERLEGPEQVRGAARRAATSPPAARCTGFTELVTVHMAQIRRIAQSAGMREDTDDIVQEVLVDADRYLQKNPMPDDPAAMLAHIAWARVWDQVRRRSRDRRRLGKLHEESVPPSQPNPEETVRLRELAEAVFAMMRPEDEMAIRLYGGLAPEDLDAAAAEAGVTASTLRSRLARARATFADLARRLGDSDPGDKR